VKLVIYSGAMLFVAGNFSPMQAECLRCKPETLQRSWTCYNGSGTLPTEEISSPMEPWMLPMH